MNKKLLTFLAKHFRSFDELMGWKWSIENLWHRLVWRRIDNFFYWLKTTTQYSIFLWNNCQDWDYGFMLNLLRFKLQRKYDFFMSDKTSISEWKEVADQIKTVIDLIDEYQEDDFTKEEDEIHNKKWGERKIVFGKELATGESGEVLGHRVSWEIENVKTEEDRKQEWEEKSEILNLGYKRKSECWNAIWDGMKKSNWWWD